MIVKLEETLPRNTQIQIPNPPLQPYNTEPVSIPNL